MVIEQCYDNIDVLKCLVRRGASVNTTDEELSTPLHKAAQMYSTGPLEYLIQNGANVNAADSRGRTPIHYAAAIKTKYKGIILLSQNGALTDVLSNDEHSKDSYDRSRYLGAPQTPLQIATQLNNYEAVSALLELGANVKQTSKHGDTALHYAFEYQETALIAELLISKGANVNAANEKGQTPLHAISRMGSRLLVEFLLDNGASINAQDNEGKTALHEIIDFDPIDQIVKLLIEKGSDLKKTDKNAQTALHYAAKKGIETCVELLIENGVEIDAVDNDNRLPLYYALKNEHHECANLLISKAMRAN